MKQVLRQEVLHTDLWCAFYQKDRDCYGGGLPAGVPVILSTLIDSQPPSLNSCGSNHVGTCCLIVSMNVFSSDR